MKGKYDEAMECYDKAIEINPKYGTAWNNKGSVLEKLGRQDEAKKYFDKSLNKSGSNM